MTRKIAESRLRQILQSQMWLVQALDTLRKVGLQDAWIAGGALRNVVWDFRHNYTKPTFVDDVDVIYYDAGDTTKSREKDYERILRMVDSETSFSVKNQARMHRITGDLPYSSTRDALMHVPDTTSSIAVSINQNGTLRIMAPYGLDDFWNMTVRPTPYGAKRRDRYLERIKKKDWQRRWPKVRIYS